MGTLDDLVLDAIAVQLTLFIVLSVCIGSPGKFTFNDTCLVTIIFIII